MATLDFKRIRAEVTEFWSGAAVTHQALVQQLVEWHSSLGLPYPPAKLVDAKHGVWDLYFPEDVVQEFDRHGADEFELEAVERYFRVRFLNRPSQ